MSLDQILMLPPGYGFDSAAPRITVPGAQSATSNVAKAITGTNLADADGNPQTVTLSVDHGTFSLAGTTGLSFSVGDGTADATMTFSGSLTNINTAIATLTYTSTTDYVGADTLSITTNDGTVSVGPSTVAITVTWTPESLGANLVAWFDPSFGAYANSAARFTAASSQNLTRDMILGVSYNTDWSLCFWVKPVGVAGSQGLVQKNAPGASFRVFISGSTYSQDWSGGPSYTSGAAFFAADTWCQVTLTYQGTGDKKIRTYKNGTLVDTSAANAGTQSDSDAGQPLYIGSLGGGNYLDGSMDSWGFWSRELPAGDVTSVYNSGSGKAYADLTTAEKVSLVSWYDFSTTASLVTDAHGSNTLTNTGSVTCDAGIVAGECVESDPVYQWTARAGTASIVTQNATLGNRPILDEGANAKRSLTFNGTSSCLIATSNSAGNLTGDLTLAVLANCTDISGDRYILSKQKATANYDGYGISRGAGKLSFEISDGTYTSKSGTTTITGSQGWKTFMAKRAATAATVYWDGTSEGSGAVQGGDTSFAIELNIGRFSGGSNFWEGGISHIVIMSDDISDAQRALLQTYLAAQVPT